MRARAGRPLTPQDVVEVMPRVELTPSVLAEVRIFLTENQIPFDDETVDAADAGTPEANGAGANGRYRPRRDPAKMAAAAMARASGSADPVKMYLKEIGKVPLLDAGEEVALAKRIEVGAEAAAASAEALTTGQWNGLPADERHRLRRAVRDGDRARQELTSANLRLVVSIAKRYVGRGVPILDPDPGGQPGPDAGGAEVRPLQGVQVLHLRHVVDPSGHHPGHRRPVADHSGPGAHGRVDQQGRPGPAGPGPEARAGSDAGRDRVGGRPRRGEGRRDPSDRSAGSSLARTRPSATRTTPRWPTSSPTAAPPHWIWRPASCWSRRCATCSTTSRSGSREVVRLRFGLVDGRPRTLEEVGKEFGVTRERIRQIESKTLAKLRPPPAQREAARLPRLSPAATQVGKLLGPLENSAPRSIRSWYPHNLLPG